METNTNDSPRQPVWQINLGGTSGLVANISTTGVRIRAIDTRRCICGARPTSAGILPCDH